MLLQVGTGGGDTVQRRLQVAREGHHPPHRGVAPVAVNREDVDPELVAKEKAIAEEQAQGKPPQAVENIVNGKVNKFYATNCLVEQGFVKNPDVSIKDHIASVAGTLGVEITVDKFLSFQVGESF